MQTLCGMKYSTYLAVSTDMLTCCHSFLCIGLNLQGFNTCASAMERVLPNAPTPPKITAKHEVKRDFAKHAKETRTRPLQSQPFDVLTASTFHHGYGLQFDRFLGNAGVVTS